MKKSRYRRVTAETIAQLARIVGAPHVTADREKMTPYSHDEVSDARCIAMPEVVVKPATTVEVARIVKLANRRCIPVTPRGAGSGLSGGAVPVCGGIVLSLERMNRILEIDRRNMMAVVEPGVVTNDINARIAPMGLFYAGYPMSEETCSIGGNVAHNAGGGRAIKYGVTEQYVLGLEVVTPTGEVVELGGKRVKDSTGYNMVKLMVRSEGTLGVVTKIILKLVRLPRARIILLALFSDTASAIGVVPKIMTLGGVTPTAIEFMDQLSVRASCKYLNEHLPYERAGAMLLIETDGDDEESVWRGSETLGELCLANGALEVFVADNPTTRQRLWNVRKNVPEAFSVISPIQGREDIVVPPASIPQLLEAVGRVARRHGLIAPCFGHAGDGNVHIWFVKRPADSVPKFRAKLSKALAELYRSTKALGGTISGEHGIGAKRKRYIRLFLSADEIALMRKIKRALDPNNIMNPGKIFDV